MLALSGCTGQARLNELPEAAPAEPIAGAAGAGGDPAFEMEPAASGGAGAPTPKTSEPAATAGAAAMAGAGGTEAPEPRRERPLEGGRVTGSITGGAEPVVLDPSAITVEDHGYVEEELLLEGRATAYRAQGELGIDGRWEAAVAGSAPYVTRLLVRRPKDAAGFNGTVLVEWLNVTAGADAAMGFAFTWEELLRGGYAWVGVSAQQAGVDSLVFSDRERYARLLHPSDAHAYSIFAQAGAAIGWPGDIDPMGGLPVQRLVAYGNSLSAVRLITFINAVHPLTAVFDGFIIHSRAGWGAPVGVESDGLLGDGTPVRVRTDLDVPVLQLLTESEVFFPLGGMYEARQPDTTLLRTWEIAGSAHADQHLVGDGADLGCGPLNDGPQHLVTKAAVRAMHQWIAYGTPAASGQTLRVTAAEDALARDALGIALDGIRTPAVDAPIALLSGTPMPEYSWSLACTLMGVTIPFTPEQLLGLYPTHEDYVDAVTASARAARAAGFILPEDEAHVLAEAIAAPVPF